MDKEAAYYLAFFILFALSVPISVVVLSHYLGPRKKAAGKLTPYECGVPLLQDVPDTLRVRFYMVALLFLLFDVEVVFLWPYAPLLFRAGAGEADALGVTKLFLLVEMAIFLGILVFGYVYAWRKGAFQWD